MALVMHKSNSNEESKQVALAPSGLDSFIQAAEMQKERSLRMVLNLQRQAEQQALTNFHHVQRMNKREDKENQIEADRQQKKIELDEKAAKADKYRQDIADAAATIAEEQRKHAEAKIKAINDRMDTFAEEREAKRSDDAERALQEARRRAEVYQTGVDLLEARRTGFLEKERRVEELMKHREELRQLQQRIKEEEEFLVEEHRQAAKRRADQILERRTTQFQGKLDKKDESLRRKQKELDQLRRMKSEEARQRCEYITTQVQAAERAYNADRDRRISRIEAKDARYDQLAEQREFLVEEMRRIRHQVQQQEVAIRDQINTMRLRLTAEVPDDVTRGLESLVAGSMAGGGATGRLLLTAGAADDISAPLLLTGSAGAASSRYQTHHQLLRQSMPELLLLQAPPPQPNQTGGSPRLESSGGARSTSARPGSASGRRKKSAAGSSGGQRRRPQSAVFSSSSALRTSIDALNGLSLSSSSQSRANGKGAGNGFKQASKGHGHTGAGASGARGKNSAPPLASTFSAAEMSTASLIDEESMSPPSSGGPAFGTSAAAAPGNTATALAASSLQQQAQQAAMLQQQHMHQAAMATLAAIQQQQQQGYTVPPAGAAAAPTTESLAHVGGGGAGAQASAVPLPVPAPPPSPSPAFAPSAVAAFPPPPPPSQAQQPSFSQSVPSSPAPVSATKAAPPPPPSPSLSSRRYEEDLREVLQEEIEKEGRRQAALERVLDEAERARLVKAFALEREEAKRRILALSGKISQAPSPVPVSSTASRSAGAGSGSGAV